jgi:hypothetical protein
MEAVGAEIMFWRSEDHLKFEVRNSKHVFNEYFVLEFELLFD